LSRLCKKWKTAANEQPLESSRCTIHSSAKAELQKGLPQSDFEWVFALSWQLHARRGLPTSLGSEASSGIPIDTMPTDSQHCGPA